MNASLAYGKAPSPQKKLWSMKRWILKWPCCHGRFPSAPPYFFWFTEVCWHILHLRPAWNKRETCTFFVVVFGQDFVQLATKTNSTSLLAFQKMSWERLQEAVAGLMWLARRLGLHHPGDCFTKVVVTKIRFCTVYISVLRSCKA